MTADRSHIKTANKLVLGRLLCRKWQPVKKNPGVRQDCVLILLLFLTFHLTFKLKFSSAKDNRKISTEGLDRSVVDFSCLFKMMDAFMIVHLQPVNSHSY